MTASLAFRCLDTHVIGGRAEEPALVDPGGRTLTFAELLHESAVIAGAWRLLGLVPGDAIDLTGLSGRHRVIAVLAAVRRELVPGEGARLAGDPPVVTIGGQDVPWTTQTALGRTDPLPAPVTDGHGAATWAATHADVLEPLLVGQPIRL